MEIMIKVTPELASALAAKAHPAAAGLHRVLRSNGAKLGQPTGTIGETRQFFPVIDVAPERVDALLRDLQGLDGVEAAYMKPMDEPP